MTQDRARKEAIRRRMDATGEKYTEARRALLGAAASSGERFPWYYEPYWEGLCRKFERQANEEGDAVARASVYFSLHSLQLLFTFTPFDRITGGCGPDGSDDWAAQRPQVECNRAVIGASTPLEKIGFGPLIERNRQIVDRVLTLIDEGAAGACEKSLEAAEERRGKLGFPRNTSNLERTTSKARSKPATARPWGDRSRGRDCGQEEGDLAFFLHHPTEKRFLGPRRGIEDPAILVLVDAWIDDLDRNYAELVDGIPRAWVEHVELDFEAVCEDLREENGHGSSADWRTGLPSPALLLLVDGGVSPQPDGIAALAGERWQIRGHRLSDGSVMPCPGTYRLTRPPTA